jgi:hypothetical protein
MNKALFSFEYREDDQCFRIECEIGARHKKSNYIPRFGWIDDYFSEGAVAGSRKQAIEWLFRAISIVRFMDGVGVKASQRRFDFGEGCPGFPLGIFDHNRGWFAPGKAASDNRWLVTNEPYNDSSELIEAWCRKTGWKFAPLPEGYGFHRPPETRLFVMAPPKIGANVDAMASAALRCLPCTSDLMPELERLSAVPCRRIRRAA